MDLRDDAEPICYLVYLEERKPNFLTLKLFWIERKHRNLLAQQIFVYGIDAELRQCVFFYFASSEVKRVNSVVRTRRKVVDGAKDSHSACVSDKTTTGRHIAQQFGAFLTLMERISIKKALGLSEEFRRAINSLIRGVSAREVLVVNRAANAALAVNIDAAESGDHSSDIFVVDLNEKVDGKFSTKNSLSRSFAEIRDKNSFKEAVPYRDLVE